MKGPCLRALAPCGSPARPGHPFPPTRRGGAAAALHLLQLPAAAGRFSCCDVAAFALDGASRAALRPPALARPSSGPPSVACCGGSASEERLPCRWRRAMQSLRAAPLAQGAVPLGPVLESIHMFHHTMPAALKHVRAPPPCSSTFPAHAAVAKRLVC